MIATDTFRDGNTGQMPARERGAAALLLVQAAASRTPTGLFAERTTAALREASERYRALATGRIAAR